jgi:cytochrome c5
MHRIACHVVGLASAGPAGLALSDGRTVRQGTCMARHGGTTATGARKFATTKTWPPRIAQGLPALINRATQGHVGRKHAEMPARGGHPPLSHAQIATALDLSGQDQRRRG